MTANHVSFTKSTSQASDFVSSAAGIQLFVSAPLFAYSHAYRGMPIPLIDVLKGAIASAALCHMRPEDS
jgi:hypothetical protein